MVYFRSFKAQSTFRLCHYFFTHSFITAASQTCQMLTEDAVDHIHVLAQLHLALAINPSTPSLEPFWTMHHIFIAAMAHRFVRARSRL